MMDVYAHHPEIDRYRQPAEYPDIRERFFWDVYQRSKAYSLLSIEAFYSLYTAMAHVARARVPGDFVECGVFLGGSVLAAAEFAAHHGVRDRRFFLYDTFTGFPQDVPPETDHKGASAPLPLLENFLGVTQSVVAQSAYPQELFTWVQGDVRESLAGEAPSEIAFLRLDTDDYASTRAELEQLYPRLAPQGVLIIDDYGYFEGARRATDEFFADRERPYLQRINLSTRIAVKP
jgi:hypothetical protein